MSANLIFCLLFASITGSIFLLLIRSYDLINKESFHHLLLTFLLGGGIAFTIRFVLWGLIPTSPFVNQINTIGIIDELSKLAALAIIFPLLKKQMDELIDGMVYMSCIAIGFAAFENVFHAMHSAIPAFSIIVGSLVNSTYQLVFSGYVGAAFFIHKKIKPNYPGILIGLLLGTGLHTLYNLADGYNTTQLFTQYFFPAIFWMYLVLLRTVIGFTDGRPILSEALFQPTGKQTLRHCCHCGHDFMSQDFRFWEITVGKCETCNHLVFDSGSAKMMFAYFRPTVDYIKFINNAITDQLVTPLTTDKKVLFHVHFEYFSAEPSTLGDWLHEENLEERKGILRTPFIGPVLAWVGFRHFEQLPAITNSTA